MLDSIIRFSLRHRLLIVAISLVVLFYGGFLAARLPIDVLPDLDRPRVVILTECPGLAPEEVEQLVSLPIETAILGASGVQDVRSNSSAGLSVVHVEFDWSADVRQARQTVQERLTTLTGQLPERVTPYMAPSSSIMGQIVIAGLYRQPGPNGGQLVPLGKSKLMAELIEAKGAEPRVEVFAPTNRNLPGEWKKQEVSQFEWVKTRPESPRQARLTVGDSAHTVVFATAEQQQQSLRSLADWVIRPRLRKIPGVAEVFIQGGERKQYQVLLDPAALIEFGVTIHQVEKTLKENNANTSGGFAVHGESERPIRIIGRLGPDAAKVIHELKNLPVRTTSKRTITLGQVAEIREGSQFRRGDGAINGIDGVVLVIAKQPHVDTRVVTDEITRALEQAEASLPADIVVRSDLFRMKNFIDLGIFNVGEALVIGAVLVLVVLFLFLLNFRTTFITLTAIPLSLVITALVFRFVGILTGAQLSINVMTLGGIAVAMGELVDDAIVDVENIFRRLKENNTLPIPRPALTVVFEASKEIRSSIVFGTAVVILVFLPLFALSGVEGRLFAPLAVAYITSILASLLVSLTVTPVLSYYLLPQARAVHSERDGFLVRFLKWCAGYLIRLSMAVPGLLLACTWALVALCGLLACTLQRDFLPKFDEGSFQLTLSLPDGASLQASRRAASAVDGVLRPMQKSADNPNGEILQFVRRTGRAELDEHAMPVSGSEYILSINPHSGRLRHEIREDLEKKLKEALPGVDVEVEQPLNHSMSHMLSGVAAEVAIKLYGDDIEKLRAVADQIKAAIEDVPGVRSLRVDQIRQSDELHVRLRPDDLAFHGLSRAHVADVVQMALLGEPVGQVIEGQRRFDLVVKLEENARTDYARLGELRIDLPDGRGQVKLRDLAEIGPDLGPNAIKRENARRWIAVSCNVHERGVANVVGDIKKRIEGRVTIPEGYYLEYGGQFESQESATFLILVLAAVSVVGMFIVLLMLYPSVPIVLQILNALPTAFIGGVVALLVTGQPLTVASLVGFISLGGIAVRNGILLVSHYFHLMKHEGEPFSEQMVMRGSLERLSPVLMTALTAGIALVPLVWAGNEPGREILYPVATVILGGLATSTFCEFLIHPGLFWRFSGQDAQRLASAEDTEEKELG